MNGYTRLSNIKADLGMTASDNDAVILRLIEDVSRVIDNETTRRFYSEVATYLFDGPPPSSQRSYGLSMTNEHGRMRQTETDYGFDTNRDLLSVTTLKTDSDGDGVFETSLAAADYFLVPDNETPYTRIELNYLSPTVPIAWFPLGRRRIQIAGLWGYSNETEITGATINMNPAGLTLAGTAMTVSDGTLFDVGETLVLESEQVYVSANAANIATLVRGINGTTPAAHAHGLAVSRRRYERPIERAAAMQVTRFWRDQQTGYSGQAGNAAEGGFSFSSLYPAIRDALHPYKRVVFA